MKYLIRDRHSWMRFLVFGLAVPTPDANSIRLFREKLTEAGTLETQFAAFDRELKERGHLAMGGQIVDATLVGAPKQHNNQAEKEAIKRGKSAGEICLTDRPWRPRKAQMHAGRSGSPKANRHQAAHRRRTLQSRIFGYKSSISIFRWLEFNRKCNVTNGARFDRAFSGTQ